MTDRYDPRRDHGRDNQGRQDDGDPAPQILEIDPRRLGLPSGPQSQVQAITDCLLRARQHANVLAPAMQLQELPPDHVITFMVVLFPTDGISTYRNQEGQELASRQQSNGVWYATDGGELAHHRAALDMLAQAAGITWVHSKCGRTDDRSKPYLWSYRMTLQIKGLDGRTREVSREYELDLRGSGDNLTPAAKKAGKGLPNARIHGAQLAESKAANRAIRAALGLHAYSMADARKPFVLPVLRWVPDAGDPVIRRMIAAKELGLVQELFGAEAAAAQATGGAVHLVDPERVIDHDPRPARAAQVRPALPDHAGQPDELGDLQAQVERDRKRDRVPVGRDGGGSPWDEQPYQGRQAATSPPQPTDADLDRYCDAKGWDRPPGPTERAQLRRHVEGRGREDYDRTMRGVR